MQKIVLPISKCIPGMITAEPIIDLQTGTTIIGQNQLLTEDSLRNMQNFIYDDIWVYLDSFDKVWQLPSETIEKYQQYSQSLTTILSHFEEEGELDNLNTLCQTLLSDFSSNHTVLGCTNLMEQLDYNTYSHSLNVAFLSYLIAKWAHYDDETVALAVKAGFLHDLGCLELPFDSTQLSALSNDEQFDYEKHPASTYTMLYKMKDLDPAIAKAVLAHHEHCDGSGFPLRLTSPYISNLAKIICLADTYENLHREHHIFEVLRILLEERLTWFDPELCFTFCHTIASYYVGSFVTLNSGDVGEVIFINPRCLHRPIVKVNDRFINLHEQKELQITSLG